MAILIDCVFDLLGNKWIWSFERGIQKLPLIWWRKNGKTIFTILMHFEIRALLVVSLLLKSFWSVYFSTGLFVGLSICLFVFPCICLSVCLSMPFLITTGIVISKLTKFFWFLLSRSVYLLVCPSVRLFSMYAIPVIRVPCYLGGWDKVFEVLRP